MIFAGASSSARTLSKPPSFDEALTSAILTLSEGRRKAAKVDMPDQVYLSHIIIRRILKFRRKYRKL